MAQVVSCPDLTQSHEEKDLVLFEQILGQFWKANQRARARARAIGQK